MGDWDRPLTEAERATIDAAAQKAWVLYEGVRTPHRSCGIAMAETFGRGTRPYQALRRGGISGRGTCGVAQSGRMILGELLGDPDPTGSVTDALRTAMAEYDERLPGVYRAAGTTTDSMVCNDLVARFDAFGGPERADYCTRLASGTAALLAEVLIRNGLPPRVSASPTDRVVATIGGPNSTP